MFCTTLIINVGHAFILLLNELFFISHLLQIEADTSCQWANR